MEVTCGKIDYVVSLIVRNSVSCKYCAYFSDTWMAPACVVIMKINYILYEIVVGSGYVMFDFWNSRNMHN